MRAPRDYLNLDLFDRPGNRVFQHSLALQQSGLSRCHVESKAPYWILSRSIRRFVHGGSARDRPGKTRACLGVLGSRPLRRGAFGEGRARLPALRRDPGPGRPEPFLFLRDLPGRGGATGAPADPPLQALLREGPALAGRPARAPLRQEPGTLRRRLALTPLP